MSKTKNFLLLAMCSALMFGLNSNASADLAVDAAGDYVAAAGGPTATLTTLPTGWSYFQSTLANGGTETALTAGAVGNQGAAYQGFVGTSTAGTASVYGTNTADPAQFEIFSNGDVNAGVVGRDLLLHPANQDFLIVRYTVSATDLAAGTGAITGSFRELVVGGGAAAQSVDVSVYHNSTSLFNTQGGTTAQGTPGILEQAAGTFNLTGLTLAAGHTIDFVVGTNGHFGADETALQASITAVSVPEPSSLAILAIGAFGLVARRRR